METPGLFHIWAGLGNRVFLSTYSWPLNDLSWMHLAGTHLSAWHLFNAIQFIPTSLSWVLKIQRTNTKRRFICQYSSCAICCSPSDTIQNFICQGNASAHWTAEMSFLRASHESPSFLNPLCWHILKTDTHHKDKPNKSCMWYLFLALPQRALHAATFQLSLLILWHHWAYSPLCSQAPLYISQYWGSATALTMRVSTACFLFLWHC